MTLGEKIKQRREELGMTQEELAKKCMYGGKTIISYIETGKRSVPLMKLRYIARALDMPMSELVDDTEWCDWIREIDSLDSDKRKRLKAYIELLKAEE